MNLTLATTHVLKIEACSVEGNLDDHLKQFWELESLGVTEDETSMYEKFVQQINYDGQRYEVSLPWKEHHPPLPDHYDLCCKRFTKLFKRLRQTPSLLTDYNTVIKDQVSKGIVEVVTQPSPAVNGRVHYLPHHGVVRQDKATSKLRIVYDASARSHGASLNNCLYTGPKFGQSIFDILLRFRAQQVALTGGIEKAFLMVSVIEEDRDSLRFLWVENPNEDPPEILTLRFTRVVFGVSLSPFLLNATINHHMERYRQLDPIFVDRFLSSIYVDDLVSGSKDLESTFTRSPNYDSHLLDSSLGNLRPTRKTYVVGSGRVSHHHQKLGEQTRSHTTMKTNHNYAESSLEVKTEDESGTNKVLGVQWNANRDELQFNIGDVISTMEEMEPTKRDVASATARFFDPLGVVSPVAISFKMFCQQLFKARIGGDDPLTGSLLERWKQLLSTMKESRVITIPRCLFSDVSPPLNSVRLVGFCDASTKAYAAVVYLRLESEEDVDVQFIAAKTRVTPVGGMTIPRLELLSAVLLSKLITNIRSALKYELPLDEAVCFSDSKVSLYRE